MSSKKKRLKHWQVVAIYLMVYDIIIIAASFFGALWFRFDCRFQQIPKEYLFPYLKFLPVYLVFCIVVFWFLRLYRSIWRFASYAELIRATMATVITLVFHVVGMSLVFGRMPISYYMFGIILQFVFTVAVRFAYRFVLLLRGRRAEAANKVHAGRVMLVGAGAAGQMILRDLKHAKEISDEVFCIIDDNPNKWGRYVDGVPVVGGREEIPSAVKRYQIEKIYVAIPSAEPAQIRDILNICKDTGCELKNLPGMFQLYRGEVTVSAMKEVGVEDLLGRDPVKIDMDDIYRNIAGKRLLVTGGGGSIGSELCRQIAMHNPELLVIFDIYENNAYDIQMELRKKYPELNLVVLIGSVRDSRRLKQVFETYHPQIVYHAAAHKHVPLMEDSPAEAIKNNVIGTYKTAYAAMMNGCRRFVLISTDKAVNPTNIMGASKRMCEMVIQSFDRMIKAGTPEKLPCLYEHEDSWRSPMSFEKNRPEKIETQFVAVRFGNVLGSNGSVIPLFKKQIAAGGPVTVTHPDIIRYFMTIPEAVCLVMQAGDYAQGGEIFVLDMGDPVKIDTLARNLIKLSGHQPDVDIKIEYVGLRPGEKLFEEKLMAEEGLKTTPNHLIHIGCPIPFDTEEFLINLRKLMKICYENQDVTSLVEQIVTTYHPKNRAPEDKI